MVQNYYTANFTLTDSLQYQGPHLFTVTAPTDTTAGIASNCSGSELQPPRLQPELQSSRRARRSRSRG